MGGLNFTVIKNCELRRSRAENLHPCITRKDGAPAPLFVIFNGWNGRRFRDPPGVQYRADMTIRNQAELARRFLELHHGPKILVLPNAWDVASARIFEEAGFPAIGTTSAGVANSFGYADGQKIPREEMLAAVRRIAGSRQRLSQRMWKRALEARPKRWRAQRKR